MNGKISGHAVVVDDNGNTIGSLLDKSPVEVIEPFGKPANRDGEFTKVSATWGDIVGWVLSSQVHANYHGGAREGAGRPALDGGSVRVTVTLTPELVAKADELGGGNTSEGIRIALKGQGTMNSGLTDNAWVKRVDEIRQMVSDVDAVPVTEDDVKFYISQFGLETWDEVEFATKEFERQYGPMLTDKK